MMFADPAIKTSVLAAIEQPLNSVLALDPVTVERLSALAGTVIELRCLEPEFHCFIRLEDRCVRLAGYNEDPVDAVISGSASSLALLAHALTHSRKMMFANIEGVVVTGQSEVIEQLQSICCDMELDWERFLSQIVGEIPGHLMAQGGRLFSQQLQQGQQMFEQNIADYIQEELRLIPSRVEIEHFSEQVSQLQASVSQLSEQINCNFPSESDSSEA